MAFHMLFIQKYPWIQNCLWHKTFKHSFLSSHSITTLLNHVTHEIIYELLNFLQILYNFRFILKTLKWNKIITFFLTMWYIVNITWTSIRSFKFQSPVTFQYENARVHHLCQIPDNPSNDPLVHSSHWQKLWYNSFTEYACYEPEAFITDNLISGVNTYRQILPAKVVAAAQVLLPVLHSFFYCFWQSLPSGVYPYTYKNDLCGSE